MMSARNACCTGARTHSQMPLEEFAGGGGKGEGNGQHVQTRIYLTRHVLNADDAFFRAGGDLWLPISCGCDGWVCG